ncbi:hypothetical protein AWR36_012160 [Microbulbifer flavimaris]|uniref:Uncharacterized protein n=1 Tax=Microbulbifer flavimaris TaxID=1781068 RepID=A0ABX4HXV5_9GAMM|nr:MULTISPECIES: hypothetical protein [Microbulbifer]KUJ82537.1 hypothetical protein AVO43_12125 [Microbulbifer sp. ZGT114]PCO04746.1 hypothetical protein AWR36_012160 [Microbulbifer flavimaris]
MQGLFDSLPLWLWFLLALLALFVARGPVHQGVLALSRFIHQVLRLAASAVSSAEKRLQRRNTEVLLARSGQSLERQIDREFTRVESTVKRELSRYPTLHRRLCEQLTAIDEDYVRSAEVPPEPTNWPKAIRAVAEIPAKEDPVVRDVLDIIHSSMRKAEAKALEAYRESARERHQLLKRMMPSWRNILTALGRVNSNVESVLERAKALDGHMQRYETLLREGERESRRLTFSAMTQFLLSTLMLGVVGGAAALNVHLVATPLQAILGGELGGEPGGFPLAPAAAVVLVALQVVVGLLMLETLRITRLFPALGALADGLRARLFWLLCGLLVVFGLLGAGLAASPEAALAGAVAEGGVVASDWAANAIRAGLALVLPLVLAFTAIPLESFLTSLRTVTGVCGVFLLRVLSLALRVAGAVALRAGAFLVRLYDIVIFLPLWLEQKWLTRRREPVAGTSEGAESGG